MDIDELIYTAAMTDINLFTCAISSVPVTCRVVAGLVTVPVFDPGSRAAFSTVGNRPGEIHLQGIERSQLTELITLTACDFVLHKKKNI